MSTENNNFFKSYFEVELVLSLKFKHPKQQKQTKQFEAGTETSMSDEYFNWLTDHFILASLAISCDLNLTKTKTFYQ